MALQLQAHLNILYTYRFNQSWPGEVTTMKKVIEQEAREKFRQLEQDCLLNRGITYDFSIEIGFVSDRIENHARKNPLAFLVMDRPVKTNNQETFEELMEHIQVPMLVVP